MNDFQPGDQIEIVFADAPEHSARGTVIRFLSDQQEGLSPEAEDYVFCWLGVPVQTVILSCPHSCGRKSPLPASLSRGNRPRTA